MSNFSIVIFFSIQVLLNWHVCAHMPCVYERYFSVQKNRSALLTDSVIAYVCICLSASAFSHIGRLKAFQGETLKTLAFSKKKWNPSSVSTSTV